MSRGIHALPFALLALLAGTPAAAQTEARFLGREEIRLYGIGLRVEPEHQTVPKDIATIVSTFLQAPTLPDVELPPLPPDAEVRATLSGPSFATPQELVVRPNTPFNIPPLTVAGLHVLDGIRVVSGGEVLLYGTPESVRIDVIDKLLVTQVVARPLTAAEIREKGIVFDKSNFQAYNFTAAFAISSEEVQITFPVVLPTIQGAQDISLSAVDLRLIETPLLRDVSTLIPDTLKLQTQIPNLSVVGFTLKAPSIEGQNFFVPPIPGVIVIPGDIGFLNQYFSVLLMVSNVAPENSRLVVHDLRAQIVLPPGADTVVGSNDDPLRMAQTSRGEAPREQPVIQPGPDGKPGTFDDILTLGPGETGNAEFLVEGRREGTHIVEMELSGMLHGLPVGPVAIRGRAAGAVLVRNPTFTLTFTHPDVVNQGERYTLDVTVTNTSTSPANFVSLNLYPRHVSGATIVGEPTQTVESIAPGDSASVTFELVSHRTGRVTAATLDSDQNVAGIFQLKTAIGELGVPLSPDSLVLPKEAGALPPDLRAAVLGLLGKAYAVATAPAAALPKDVRRFSKKVVWERAIEAAQAGFRVSLHEPMRESATHLAFDFMGGDFARLPERNPRASDLEFARSDAIGFDEIRRKSVRGDVLAAAVAARLEPDLTTLGALAFHRDLAEKVSYRPVHQSVLVQSAAGPLPIELVLVDAHGRRVGGVGEAGKVIKEVPFSDFLTFGELGMARAQLAVVASPEAGELTIQLKAVSGASADARFTLSVVLPAPDGRLRQITFDDLSLDDVPAFEFETGDPWPVKVELLASDGASRSGSARPASTSALVEDPAPRLLGAVQQAEADVLTCEDAIIGRPGRIIAVLFSEEVTRESVQDRLAPGAITHYAPEGNAVVGVALQPGGRIAFLALRDPVGPFVPRQITIQDVADRRGQMMAAETVPIEPTVEDPAGVVSGQILLADGTPAAFASVRLLYRYRCGDEILTLGISSKAADADGRYSWDYVLKDVFADRLAAVDPQSEEARGLDFSIARHAQRLNVNLVFLGRGTLQGQTVGEDGTPLEGTVVRVTSLTDHSQYGARTGADGRFTLTKIPVGNILIEAVNARAAAQVFISEHIPFAGALIQRDIVLLNADTTGVVVRKGTLTGYVLRADGVTPVADVPVIAFYQNRSQPGVRCPPIRNAEPLECAIATGRTGVDGSFSFSGLIAGALRLYAFNQAALEEGDARIVLPADGEFNFNLLLTGGLGVVRGVVLDQNGQAVPGARVGGGLSVTTADESGQFLLVDVPLGRRTIVAVSDALGARGSVTIDLIRPGEEVGATVVLESVGSVAGRVFRADGVTPVSNISTYLFEECTDAEGNRSICIVGQAVTDDEGGYRIDGIRPGRYSLSAFLPDFSDGNIVGVTLSYHRQVVITNLRFRGGGGRVRGVVYDDDGVTPLKAAVSISGDQLVVAGGRIGARFEYVQNYRIVETDFTTGRFSFDGVWVGPFTMRAAGQFSPDPVSLEATMPAAGATVELTLRLQSTSEITGVVYQPDGVTPVGANVIVKYKSNAFKVFCAEDAFGDTVCTTIPQGIQEATVVTDEHGQYWFPIVNAGAFTLTAEDPASGRMGEVRGAVRAGERAELSMRLLGIGELTVQVRASDAVTPIPGAKVEVAQLEHPYKKLVLFADDQGVARFAGGDAFSEGPFVVSALDVRNGFAGRASGRIASDGQQLTVNVFLFNATGSVSGTVFRSDGFTPVPNAEVVIANASGPLAFAVTDADGRYFQDLIPLGAFTVESFEAATAARGSAGGRIDLDGQEVPVNVVQRALGLIKGVVVEAGTLAPLKGWEVALQQTTTSGRSLPALKTTTGIDGSFSFPGASVGAFTLFASRASVAGSATVSGSLDRAGEAIDVPIVVNILRPAFGRIEGIVFNPAGGREGNGQVTIQSRSGVQVVTAAADGTFFLDDVPLGRFTVTARSQVSNDVGVAIGELLFDGSVAQVAITLVGLSRVSGTIERADGTAAANARVVLTGSPATGCGGPCTTFANASGEFTFPDVAARTFTVTGTDPISGLKGAIGDELAPGEHKVVRVVLQPSGVIRGRVLFASGNAARGVVGELVQGTRRLFVETADDGTFAFEGVALGNYSLTFRDPIGPGIARRNVGLTGEALLGDIVLDEAAPVVAEVDPAASATGVPLDGVIRLLLSEPIDPSTVNVGSVALTGPAGAVTVVTGVTDGDRRVLITPLNPLQDQARYTLRVTGVKDRVGRVMAADFVSSFTTVDITAPTYLDVSPGPNVSGVTIFSPIRVKYSEPIDPTRFSGPPLVLTGPQGAVEGRLDYLFGNTVLVFTPGRPLFEGAVYRVQLQAAVDIAGNAQAGALEYVFATTDRTPPELLGLVAANGGTVIENAVTQVVAQVGTGSDVAVVDFFINDVFAFASRGVPFALSFQAIPEYGTPGRQIKISAIATDTSGNRGVAAVSTFVTVLADAPPAVVIAGPADGTAFQNGDRVVVTVQTTDDLGVTQVGYRAATGDARDAATRAVAPAAMTRTDTFAFHVPQTAPPGARIQVQASAVDTKGTMAVATPIEIVVRDNVAPDVTITGVTTGERVRPGQQATAIVVAEDLGGIAAVGFTVSGAASFAQTRTIAPAQTSIATAFTFTVSPGATPNDSVFLDAFAIDQAGLRRNAARVILPVADGVPPTVRLRPENGRFEMVPGRSVNVVAEATDEIGVARIELIGSGAFSLADARAVSPPLGSATTVFTINVPASVPAGGQLTLQGRAVDISGNVSTPVSIVLNAVSLADVSLPSSLVIVAGETIEMEVRLPEAAPAGGLRIDFASTDPNVASIVPSVIFAQGESLRTAGVSGVSGGTVTINALIQGVQRGSTTATVRGGVVRGTVFNPQFEPVPGAQVTVQTGGVTLVTVTDDQGQYFVEGATGNVTVTVRARDPETELLGYATGNMNRPNGFATINVVLISAGAFHGTVFNQSGAPVGAGVRVDLFAAGDPRQSLSTTFTADDGTWQFPLVAIGDYTIEAFDADGNRGRSHANISASGQEVEVPVTYLGRGVVTGLVLDGGGAPVPNATVTLRATSLFGSAAARTVNAGQNGSYEFSRVFVGSFTVEARDPVTNQAGAASGSLALHGQVVNQDIHLAPYGNLQGTIFRADGTTPVGAGASVVFDACGFPVLQGCRFTTVTDETGGYAFNFLPLRAFVLTVSDSATRGRARVTGALTVNGATVTLNASLLPQGTLVVTVRNAGGATVTGASVVATVSSGGVQDTLSGTTGSDGVAILERLLAGAFSVQASAGGLTGSATGTLAADQVAQVTITLEPTGTIAGTVLAPDGQTPVTAGSVRVRRQSVPFTSFQQSLTDGEFAFEGLPLGTYRLDALDATGRLRAFATDIELTSAGEVEERHVVFVGLGAVTGRVLNPDGSSASNLSVSVQSLNPSFGGFRSATTDAAGFYTVTGLAVGAVVARTGNTSQNLLGEATGLLTRDGETITVDILLQNNAINLPVYRVDANDSWYRISGDGAISDSIQSVFRGISGADQDSMVLDLVRDGAAHRFPSSSIGTFEDGGSEIVVRQQDVAGLSVTRKAYVPADGYFMRRLEMLTNPTDDPITVDVRVRTNIRGVTGSPRVIASSSGDAMLSVADAMNADRWATFDDTSDGDGYWENTSPPVAIVFDGPDAARQLGALSMAGSPAVVTQQWNTVTVPPGGTVALMYFVSQQTSRAAARATAERLVQLPPEAVRGLSAFEIAAIQNFAVPADGIGSMEPLPRLDGTINGRVLEGDASTPVPFAAVRFTSEVPFYARLQYWFSDGTGAFRITASPSQPVPIGGFRLVAHHPRTWMVESPAVVGAFGPGETTTTQDVVFSNTAIVRGVVRRFDGGLATGGFVEIRRDNPWFFDSVSLASDGSYALTGIPQGTFTLRAQLNHPQGTGVFSQPQAVEVVGGPAITRDITLVPTGTLTGTIRNASGTALPNRPVSVISSDHSFSRSTVTDTSGRYTSSDMPVGTYSVRSWEPSTGIESSATFTIVAGQTTTQDLTYVGLGTLQVQVNRTSGGGVAQAFVEAFNSQIYRSATASAAGSVSFSNLPLGTYTVRASHSGFSLVAQSQITLSANGDTVVAEIALPPFGRVEGRATLASGAAVPNRTVSIFGNTFFRSALTDANGDYAADGIPTGDPFTVRITHPQDSQVRRDVSEGALAADAEVRRVDLRLPALATVRVTTLRSDGTPFPGIRIHSSDSARTFFQNRGTTNTSGVLDILRIPEGAFNIRAHDPNTGIALALQQGEVRQSDDGGIVPIEVVITSLDGNLQGTIFLADGVTPMLAYVQILNAADQQQLRAGFTDANGRYSFSNVLTGAAGFIVRAWSPRFNRFVDVPGAFTVTGETKIIDVTLPMVRGTISGRVVAEDGVTPIPNANVYLYDAGAFVEFRSSGADGRFEFANVTIGTAGFLIRVYDHSFTTFIDTPGILDPATGPATVAVTLPGVIGSVRGRVFAADGVTPVPHSFVSAIVWHEPPDCADCGGWEITLASTYADESGAYHLPAVLAPSGQFRLRAHSPRSGDIRVDLPIAFGAQGAELMADVALPIANVDGTVRFHDGTPVPYPSVYLQIGDRTWYPDETRESGTFLFRFVPLGAFTLVAQDSDSGLVAQLSGEIPAGTGLLTIDATLPASGSVRARVLGRDGSAAPDVWVGLVSAGLGWVRWGVTDETGTAVFDRVPVGPVHLHASYYDGTLGHPVFAAASGEVADSAELMLELSFANNGVVRGAVSNPDGSPAAHASVRLAGFGALGPAGYYNVFTRADDQGAYEFEAVPLGLVQVVASNDRDVYGIARGTLASAAEPLALDVTLGGAVELDHALVGSDEFVYDVEEDGRLGDGGNVSRSLNDAYDGAYRIELNGSSFCCVDAALVHQEGQELVLGAVPVGSTLVTRRIFVPAEGGFARFLEVLENPTGIPQTFTLRIRSNLGSDSSTEIVLPPGETGNTYAVTRENRSSSSDPALAHVFSGSGAVAVPVRSVRFVNGSDDIRYEWQVTVPAGGRVMIMHFAIQRAPDDVAGAQAQAEALVNLADDKMLRGLSSDERATIVNFVIP